MKTSEIRNVATPLLHDYLAESARRLGDKVALVAKGERFTYGQLEQRAIEMAAYFERQGVQRGDRVLVFADNTVESVIAFWAVLRANAVVSVINPLTKDAKLAYLLNDCRATALVTDAHLRRIYSKAIPTSAHLKLCVVSGKVDEEELSSLPGGVHFDHARIPGAPAPERTAIDTDLAAIIYTSGSTGDAKGVMLTHRNMLTAATSVSSYLEMQEDDVVLSALPLAFDYGLYQVIMSTRVGARVILERSFAYPAKVLTTMREEKVTGFPGVPTMFATLAGMDKVGEMDWSSLRFVTNTAAALPTKHITMLREIFPDARIYSMYGLTECQRCTYLPPAEIDTKPDSVGVAIPNTEMWLVDDEDRRVGPGQVGQLVIRGATVMRGYWEKPEATAKMLRPGPLPGEQVLYTGDLCRQDEAGYLYFVGRTDDIIKSRGEKVAPKEVENVLTSIDGVHEVAVIGVADELHGQAIKAFIVLQDGVEMSEKQIQHECQQRLESFMVPKHVVFVSDLPKGPTGKIKKSDLS